MLYRNACFIVPLVWGLLSIETYFALGEKDQIFFILFFPVLFFPFFLKDKRKKIEKPVNRLMQCHYDLKIKQQQSIKNFCVSWGWLIITAVSGWGSYLIGKKLRPSLFTHPTFISLFFLFFIFITLKIFEKSKVIDNSIMSLTKKGLSIEKRMKNSKVKYFSLFVKRMKGILGSVSQLFYILPLLLLFYLLIIQGLYPLAINRFPFLSPTQDIIIKTTLPSFALISLIYYQFANKYKKLR